MKPKEQIKSIEETFPEGYEGGEIKIEIQYSEIKISHYQVKNGGFKIKTIKYSLKCPSHFAIRITSFAAPHLWKKRQN